ncbi:hypothetical protein CBM2599_A160113 [Cupriavidus taiwanensis]|nr:hypothetical protein CBM2599_A160113 [Cupriavidus taiwanensis]SOY84910.1 hypothetical protein CBM2600_A140372 [Cupriavidus taiwanensis]
MVSFVHNHEGRLSQKFWVHAEQQVGPFRGKDNNVRIP